MMKKTIMGMLVCICLASSATASKDTKPVTTKKPSATKNAAATAAATRTLDAIRIEGEIDVPQVLFITARDYRRFRDRAPAPYTITSAAVAKSVPLPDRLRLVAPAK
jgi:hypothetical protein